MNIIKVDEIIKTEREGLYVAVFGDDAIVVSLSEKALSALTGCTCKKQTKEEAVKEVVEAVDVMEAEKESTEPFMNMFDTEDEDEPDEDANDVMGFSLLIRKFQKENIEGKGARRSFSNAMRKHFGDLETISKSEFLTVANKWLEKNGGTDAESETDPEIADMISKYYDALINTEQRRFRALARTMPMNTVDEVNAMISAFEDVGDDLPFREDEPEVEEKKQEMRPLDRLKAEIQNNAKLRQNTIIYCNRKGKKASQLTANDALVILKSLEA